MLVALAHIASLENTQKSLDRSSPDGRGAYRGVRTATQNETAQNSNINQEILRSYIMLMYYSIAIGYDIHSRHCYRIISNQNQPCDYKVLHLICIGYLYTIFCTHNDE